MVNRRTIVLVLRSGGDFGMRDVELITRHIRGKWQSSIMPRIICLWDKASMTYELGNITYIPLTNQEPGTWSRIQLYSPEMEQYRPFLYVDLDTAIIESIERVFDLVKDPSMFITLEDLWERGRLATGLVWFPANSKKIKKVWDNYKGKTGFRMDAYLRSVVQPDLYWQMITAHIHDFKPKTGKLLSQVPKGAEIVCFHGKPRIFQASEGSLYVPWVKQYVNTQFEPVVEQKKEILVTVIIPYKTDRGWLQEAINSVPPDVQVLVSQGDGNWPANFNKALPQAKGKYIKFLHEDDMIAPNGITNLVRSLEEQNADFVHAPAFEIYANGNTKQHLYEPAVLYPTLKDMLKTNVIHAASLMYRREVFDKVGLFDETLNTAEEYEFNLRCLKAGLKIGYCPNPVAFYRRHPMQKVRTVPESFKRAERNKVRKQYA